MPSLETQSKHCVFLPCLPQLLVRRFTKAGGRKQYPSVWCDSSITTDEDLMEGYLAAMQEPI